MTKISGESLYDGSVSVDVNSGSGDYLLKSPHRAISVAIQRGYNSGDMAVLSTERARELSAALLAKADAADALAEAAKPKPVTRREHVRSFPVGTIFSTHFHGFNKRRYVRLPNDQVIRLDAKAYGLDSPNSLQEFSGTSTDLNDFVIEYKPEEAK